MSLTSQNEISEFLWGSTFMTDHNGPSLLKGLNLIILALGRTRKLSMENLIAFGPLHESERTIYTWFYWGAGMGNSIQ